MLNDTQFSRLLRNLCSLEACLDERILRAFQQSPYDERMRCLIEQRMDVHRLMTWFISSLTLEQFAIRGLQILTDLSAIQNSPLAESCWAIFSEHMPYRAFLLAGDCGRDKHDGVAPNQMMLPM